MALMTTPAPTPIRSEPHPRPTAQLATLAAVVSLVAAGCSVSWPWRGGSPEPVPEPEPPLVSAPTEESRDWRIDFVETLLARGEGYLASGALTDAENAFQDALYWIRLGSTAPIAEQELRAKWGLALTYLTADQAVRQSERTRQVLQEIADQEGSADSLLASWIVGALDEIRRLRSEVSRQQELIRTLNETVEQLKLIDLTRRPAGSTPTDATSNTVQPGPLP